LFATHEITFHKDGSAIVAFYDNIWKNTQLRSGFLIRLPWDDVLLFSTNGEEKITKERDLFSPFHRSRKETRASQLALGKE